MFNPCCTNSGNTIAVGIKWTKCFFNKCKVVFCDGEDCIDMYEKHNAMCTFKPSQSISLFHNSA